MSGKPRIMQVVGSLGIGGAERVGMELAHGASNLGWESFVISATVGRNIPEYCESLGSREINIFELGERLPRKAWELMRIVKRVKPDIVHVHTELPELLAIFGKVVRPDTILLRTLHNTVSWPKHKVLEYSVGAFYSMFASMTLACAEAVPGNYPVVANGVSWSEESFRKNPFQVAFVGRMVPDKNPESIIEICRRAKQECPGLVLHMVGGGELLDYLRPRHSVEWIVWHGPLPSADPIMRFSKVLLLASQYEGLPLVTLEALVDLTSVIGPDLASLRRLGWIDCYPPGDYDTAANLVAATLNEPEDSRARKMREIRDRMRSTYSIGGMVDKYLAVYDSLLSDSRGIYSKK